MVCQGHRLHPPLDAAVQRHPGAGMDTERPVRADHERVGKRGVLQPGLEPPALCLRPLRDIRTERTGATVIVRRWRQGNPAPDFLIRHSTIDLCRGNSMPQPPGPVPLHTRIMNPVTMNSDKVLSPARKLAKNSFPDRHSIHHNQIRFTLSSPNNLEGVTTFSQHYMLHHNEARIMLKPDANKQPPPHSQPGPRQRAPTVQEAKPEGPFRAGERSGPARPARSVSGGPASGRSPGVPGAQRTERRPPCTARGSRGTRSVPPALPRSGSATTPRAGLFARTARQRGSLWPVPMIRHASPDGGAG
ncbi:hypothetical protein SRB5_70630 [Streptomyces sp. RB5]|uniref:Uncharacterized protein n=1 Tax=Streptomyces smaragdinus TaxID=2585196 RepID=A0A7K0CTS6_9ACTN|nr:hypothetical protein [Streptomyces smaragdinus]